MKLTSARDYGRFVLPVLGLCLIAGLSACSPYRTQTAQEPPPAVIDAPRSSRGNPPFYEVFGKRYYVLASSAGYNETGVASWYGRDFHGQPTSGGETYNMHGLTAAHKTLPIPTWVEVRNLGNGKRVIVKVNDRGPFVGDRIIDLSMRAAEEIDMIRAGTARVEVRVLGAPGAAPDTRVAAQSAAPSRNFSIISEAVADVPGPDDAPFRQMYMQVGAFSQHRNAAKLEVMLKNNGFTDSFIVSGVSPQDSLHRVRIGPLQSADQFDRVNDGLRALGLDAGRLVVDN